MTPPGGVRDQPDVGSQVHLEEPSGLSIPARAGAESRARDLRHVAVGSVLAVEARSARAIWRRSARP